MARSGTEGACWARTEATNLCGTFAANCTMSARSRSTCVCLEKHDASPHPWSTEGARCAEIRQPSQQAIEERFVAFSPSEAVVAFWTLSIW